MQYILFLCLISEIFCQYCKYSLDLKTDVLLIHSRSCSWANRPDKKFSYVCIFCKYHTSQMDHMRDHIRSHVGDKPFKCQFCKYSGTQKTHLNKHVKKMHTLIHCSLKE
uniref:RE1-silencing transcription factor A n=1 Tax=Cacopsylla melanoneura TaxID=428564 RepID=A0A8D8MEF8_9HEMI